MKVRLPSAAAGSCVAFQSGGAVPTAVGNPSRPTPSPDYSPIFSCSSDDLVRIGIFAEASTEASIRNPPVGADPARSSTSFKGCRGEPQELGLELAGHRVVGTPEPYGRLIGLAEAGLGLGGFAAGLERQAEVGEGVESRAPRGPGTRPREAPPPPLRDVPGNGDSGRGRRVR